MSDDYTKGESGAETLQEATAAYEDRISSVDSADGVRYADCGDLKSANQSENHEISRPWLWKPGESGNPAGGRKAGVVYPTEALTRYVGTGELPPPPLTPAWKIAKAITERAETGDPRAVTVVLDRIDGKVPERVQVGLIQGVTLLPSDQLEPELWGKLYGHSQRLGVQAAIPAAALPAVPEDDSAG